MALFSKKPKTESKEHEKAVKLVAPKDPKSSNVHFGSMNYILSRPRITEKASMKAENESAYVFDVSDNSNKKTIAGAFEEIYKIKPKRVNITRIPSKNVFVRGKKGVKTGGKKAYVYLKKGEKIEVV